MKTRKSAGKSLAAAQREQLLQTLEKRFLQHRERHPGVEWAKVKARLQAGPGRLWSLHEMERTGGEPDVTGCDDRTGEILFVDCSTESPEGRRSLCYDREGLESRKDFPPKNSAIDLATAMGIEVLTEEQYLALQQLGEFDGKTSSWIKTPAAMRQLGGALYGDRRYERVFIGHNGAQSYYAGRGFRGVLRV